jgi:3-deoxy-7-phosphoheptulonate synthase
MRVYFEKPRTSLGWRGLITDPYIDGSYEIGFGLRSAREILLEVTEMGVPTGSEMLDPIVPNYIDDLISWAAIGARTTESQTHREMASGLSMPVGFKNGTDGSYESAVNALKSSREPHSFIGIDQEGNTCVVSTAGNPDVHIISRGSGEAPNYSPVQLIKAERLLREAGVDPAILIDCSHGNSGKDHTLQEWVLRSLTDQRMAPNDSIIGFMIESNLLDGNQKIPENIADLTYGLSITDPCVGWDNTERMILDAYESLK